MSNQSEVSKFSERVDSLRAQKGLSDLKFYAGEVSESSPETFAREANEMLDAVVAGKVRAFKFNDAEFNDIFHK